MDRADMMDMPETLLTQRIGEPPTPETEVLVRIFELSVRLCNLPPLSTIASRVFALSGNPEVNIKDLAAAMESDPAFAADVLFLANSSLFGFPSKVQAIRHAIALIGLERIQAIAVTALVRSFVGKGGTFIRQCWQHSAACAIIAEQIAPNFGAMGDVVYSVGLVHDIGRLGLLKSDPTKYAPVLRGLFEGKEEVLRAERSLFGIDHGLAGAWLAKHWAFPPEFIQACGHHHEPVNATDSSILQVIKTACRMADAVGFAAIHDTNAPAYEDVIQSLPSVAGRKTFPSKEALQANIEIRLKSFE